MLSWSTVVFNSFSFDRTDVAIIGVQVSSLNTFDNRV